MQGLNDHYFLVWEQMHGKVPTQQSVSHRAQEFALKK